MAGKNFLSVAVARRTFRQAKRAVALRDAPLDSWKRSSCVKAIFLSAKRDPFTRNSVKLNSRRWARKASRLLMNIAPAIQPFRLAMPRERFQPWPTVMSWQRARKLPKYTGCRDPVICNLKGRTFFEGGWRWRGLRNSWISWNIRSLSRFSLSTRIVENFYIFQNYSSQNFLAKLFLHRTRWYDFSDNETGITRECKRPVLLNVLNVFFTKAE